MPQYQLTDVEVEEVSLVGRPANMRKYLLYKNEAGQPGGVTDPPSPTELVKSLSDTQRAELRKALGVDDEIAALTKSVGDMRRAGQRAEYVALAKAEGFIHGSPEEHADRLLDMADKMGPEAVEKAIEREKAIAAALKTSGLLTEIGKSGAGPSGGAGATLEQRALEAVAKSEGKTDFAAAFSQLLKSEPALAAQYRAESREVK